MTAPPTTSLKKQIPSSQLMVNRIVRWAKNISHGKADTRQTKIDAEFIEAGTVGAAPES